MGIVKVNDNGTDDVSEYSVFVKAELGRGATRDRFGYSFALTFVSPLRKDSGEYFGKKADPDLKFFPNEFGAVFPEIKLQLPRVLPFDLAVGGRLFGIYPSRASLFLSKDAGSRMTIYSNYSVDFMGQLLHAGIEVHLTPRSSIFVEYSRWLSEYRYPPEVSHDATAHPNSMGLCISYHPSRG